MAAPLGSYCFCKILGKRCSDFKTVDLSINLDCDLVLNWNFKLIENLKIKQMSEMSLSKNSGNTLKDWVLTEWAGGRQSVLCSLQERFK